MNLYSTYEEAEDALLYAYKSLINHTENEAELKTIFSGAIPTVDTKDIVIIEVYGYIPSIYIYSFLESQNEIIHNDTNGAINIKNLHESRIQRLYKRLQEAYQDWLIEEDMFPLTWEILSQKFVKIERID